jgi:hypothetical protein
MEHLTESQIHYVISGASNVGKKSNDHINNVPNDSLKFYWANDIQLNGALCLVKANKFNMTIEYIETISEKKLYQINIANKYLQN